ncbi:pyruvate orthophosphate dikinase2 [Tanacetum coccineum]
MYLPSFSSLLMWSFWVHALLPEVFLEVVPLSLGRGVTVHIPPPSYLALAGFGYGCCCCCIKVIGSFMSIGVGICGEPSSVAYFDGAGKDYVSCSSFRQVYLRVGICAEHDGEPSSVAFFDVTGFDYVSCSPFRVPIARLTAAQVIVQAS